MAITLKDVSKRYGDNNVLDQYMLDIEESEMVCIMGESGCGKTTLLHILLGLIEPDSGHIEGVPEEKAAVFQEDRLCLPFTSISNVKIGCKRKVSEEEIKSHLTEIGLGHSLYLPVSQLSGGMRRRVAIARAMITDSKLIIMDEPFKGLDDALKMRVINYVRKNKRDRTMIVVTHDEEEAKILGGRLIRMD